MSQLVIDATNQDLEDPDWGMLMTLCDNVNQRGDTYRQDVINAIDSRLKNKNNKVVSLTLILLDTLEKNCFGPFHQLVCQKEFLDNLFQIATKERSEENSQEAADLVQCLALSFASVGKEYKLFHNLYRSLRNRGITFRDDSEIDIFTPNLSDEVVQNLPSGVHVRYTSPNAKLENDLHIVQQHMMKMHSLITKRNRRNGIPENKKLELDEENDFLSQCLIRLIDLKCQYDQLDIPKTTRDLCNMLKTSIITLLRASNDVEIDVRSVKIFPDDSRQKESSDDESDNADIFF